MPALSVQPTFPIFTAADGQPLENGYLWLGTANLDPQTNPITVYWDADLTIVAAQPIRTSGGYPANNGTPARLYVNSDYSIRVQNKNGTLVYSAPEATERFGGGIVNASQVVYDPSGTGAVATTVQTKLRESVSVKDFGAVGDGVTDDGPDINTAIAALSAAGGGVLFFPEGVYNIDTVIALQSNVHLNISALAILDVATLTGSVAIQAQGTVGSAVTLASNASRTNTSVAVAAGAEAGFAVGDYVLVYSERQPDASAQKDGEFQIVKSTSSGSIVMQDGLWADYATANTASIRKLNAVSNVRVYGGGTIRGSGTNDKLLTFYRCLDVHVQDIIFEDGDYESLTFQAALNFSANDCSFYRSNNTGAGYGVAVYDGCQWGDIAGNRFIDCRHGVSGGGNIGGYGLNRFINVIGNNAYGGLDSGYDGHSPCQYWNFVGNTATAKNGTNSDGITWQGLDVVISDNTLIGCKNYGVLIEPRRAEDQTGIKIVGNS
jgi:hypothetical protein